MKLLAGLLLAVCLPATPADVPPKPHLPAPLDRIGIDQNLNAQIPLDAVFRDENGSAVKLGDFFGKRSVLLAPVYYRCPMLCSQILSGIVAGLRPLSLLPGRDFDVVVFSIDPSETPTDAAAKRDLYTRRYSHERGSTGWHFLVGSEQSIRRVTEAIGFRYRWDEPTKMFIHASGIMVATPEGKLARYLYGVEYEPKDLKLSLIEASRNRIGSPVDRILLFCYHYDPATGKYGAVVLKVLRLAGIAALAAGLLILLVLWRRDLKRDRRALASERT